MTTGEQPSGKQPDGGERTMKRRAPVVSTKGPVLSLVINTWRVSLLFIFWHFVSALVWLRNHTRLPKWLGSDSREVGVRLWTIAWLTFVWVLLWGTVSWANIIGGVVLAVAVLTVLPLPRVPVEGRIHPLSLARLVVRLVVDFFVSSLQIGWMAIRPGRPPLGAVVRVRVAIKSDMVLTLAVDYLNLVPGTMVLEIDHRRRMLYVHVFDVRSEKKVRAFYDQVAYVERMFIKAFERDSEWHPSPYHGIDEDFHHVRPIQPVAGAQSADIPTAAAETSRSDRGES
ncbi:MULTISPECIES: Na+/H+ antiporter subunit E [Gordonia]|jgi:multicomponent Na+:H+ antiporter subunit E|uniref:Na(+)/H(+) antiporter subunit E n=1 Tax=Gordonia alkanivorans NBRC 16433 TaxID=1027371 RepID=F9VTL2_9ACTN|nr:MULTISPECIES: Na+/H+ antiporter subunit E [Gordonia]MDH3007228.1 Na+/H+ antiporter subunit E [Gordonia alkanivorans]MDH3012963.1 Na+/H+ antiporter subunit E [Gordonia alkanivorans]MDH3016969.1 Na+/H+ antiporter subunit E [Gordonia alkanivorans]MDH3021866.1 Na+/H+ antiporter subunit E [Gordonia alkanivorans]MDH3024837.1 Na+/H+ antiporter subunit E [Gordonia alkanivorans]